MTLAVRTSEISNCLETFEAGWIDDWSGLPDDLTLSECSAAWNFDEADQYSGSLGADPTDAAYLYAETAQYAGGLRLWVEDQATKRGPQKILAIEGRHPRNQGSLVLAPDAGPPEATASARLGLIEFDRGELIYPSRGLAVRINPENGVLLGLIGFEPTTVADYLARLRPIDRVPFPARIGVAG